MCEHINHIGIYIGNFLIPYYGLFAVIGLTVAFCVAYYQVKRYKLNFDNFILLSCIAVFFAIIGSKLLFIIISWNDIDVKELKNMNYLKNILNGGFVFYGGLIGALIGIYICKKVLKIEIKEYLRYCIPVIPTVHAFGRIGCSLVGCCYGCPFESPISVIYTNSPFAPNNIALFPVQRIESISLFLIAIALLIYINKFNGKYAFEYYIFTYAIVRFILEYFRYDEYRGVLNGLSISQYISIFLVICVIVKIIIFKDK